MISVIPDCKNMLKGSLGKPEDEKQPTVGDMTSMVRMPVRVLTTRCSMEIKDGVDAMPGAYVDDAIQVFET